MNDVVTNPFGAPAAQSQGGTALAQSDQQRAIAEVQAAMMIARMNPRDPIAAMDRILNAFTRPTLADQAVYQYSRGGSDISGPSIRSAEAIAQMWGNMQFGFREISRGRDPDGVTYSEVEAFAWDVESNTRRPAQFRVRHWRDTKKGGYKVTDERDIYELVANNAQRRVRACILAVIPGDVIESAIKQAETTMRVKADVSPEAIQKMIEAFAPFGVTKEQIEKRIQRRLDAIQPAQVVALKKIYASLRDGMSTAADWFETEPPEPSGDGATSDQPKSKVEAAKDQIRQRRAASQEQPPTGEQINPTELGERVALALPEMAKHGDIDTLSLWADSLPDAVRADDRFTKAFRARMDELKTPKK